MRRSPLGPHAVRRALLRDSADCEHPDWQHRERRKRSMVNTRIGIVNTEIGHGEHAEPGTVNTRSGHCEHPERRHRTEAASRHTQDRSRARSSCSRERMTRPLVLRTATLALLLVLFSACRAAQPAPGVEVAAAQPGVEAAAAQPRFEHLQQLAGCWKCTADTWAVDLVYRLVSSGSALVESFTTASGKETLTIFHLDDSRLLATHYCAQGNQPRLRLDHTSDRTFVFVFQDATNLSSPAASHLDRLELELIDADHYRRIETYVADGKEETTRFDCQRVP
jgi:hypothetical protein